MDNSKLKSSKITPETSYNRACDACRHHKVRCLPGAREPSKTCQRCEKMDRSCVFTAPQKRKQRKRTDTRVAELEREVQAMRALFDPKAKRSKLGNGDGNVSEMQISNGADEQNSISGPAFSCLPPDVAASISGSSPQSSTGSAPVWTPAPFSEDVDVVDRGIVSIEQAEQLLQIYNTDIVQNYHPVIVFAPELTAEELRRTKPTLFLAVIAAASGKVSPTLLSVLNSEALTAYAHRTIVNGEKSLELVQAMIITCIWYNPPGKFSRLKFYEYIHMAVIMAIDLGYGTNPRGSRNRRGDLTVAPTTLSDLEVEQRRTFLLCFVISLNAAISLRRPNMLRYNPWLDECVETLENLPNVSSSDRTIVAWVRLARITEDIHTSLSFDDIGNVANLSDTRTQMMVCGFGKALQGWEKSFEYIGNKSLLMAYHHSQIFLHEPALHDDHPPEHFRPPFGTDTLFTHTMDSTAKSTHIEATTACVCHAHSLLDIVLSMSMGELRSVPVFAFVRMVYAVIILTKIYISSKSPSSKIGSSFDSGSLKLDFYLEALIKKVMEAAGPMECRAPLTFLGLVIWIRIWYKRQENDAVFSPPTNLPERTEACMIPPVSYRAFAEDQFVNDQLINKFNESMPKTEGEKADTYMTGKNYYDLELELEQEFEPFELAGLDPDFNAWNADMSMNLPLVLDNNYELPNFDWGFSPTTNGAL